MAERIVYRDAGKATSILGRHVMAGDAYLDATRRGLRHSPDGFAWGYLGSGPACLAHSLLAHATGDEVVADEYYQAFKVAHVSRWEDGWRISRGAVWRWLEFAQAGIDAPQVWWDAPPDPPAGFLDWLDEQPLTVYCDVARLAYYRADGVLGDLLEEHGQDRLYAGRICANLPDSWLTEE